MDPITLIVTALALGAAAGLKPTAEQAIKDAYGGLKMLIKRKYDKVSVDHLEETPESQARRDVVKEDLKNTNAGSDEEVLRKTKELLDVLQTHAPEVGVAFGVDLERFKADSLAIEGIIASGGGVRVRDGEFAGPVVIKDVTSGTRDYPPKE
jgi:hypothetical protein